MREQVLALGTTAAFVLCTVLYVFIGRARWSLVKEGRCLRITRHGWVRTVGVCPHTYDELHRDELDTDFHFDDGTFVVGCRDVGYDGPLPARIRLEVNWLGAYRVVPIAQETKVA